MLTEEQKKARDHLYGPCLVTAGPGSGKTRVLTERIVHLLRYTRPERICVITFTRAAAEQMKSRFCELTDEETAEKVTFGTFHSVFFRWLVQWHELGSDIKILGRDGENVPAISMGQWDTNEEYAAWKKIHHYIDFDDIIHLTQVAIQNHFPDRMYDFFLIDEFQDIDQEQYKIACRMAGDQANLFVVGDEDQSIYGFRGSCSSVMLQFMKDYPSAAHLFLSTNFRCSRAITNLSVRLISHNKERYDKNIDSFSRDMTPVRSRGYVSTLDELRDTAKRIRQLHIFGKVPYEKIAVLARTGREADLMIQALREAGIPYRQKIRSSDFIHRKFLDIGQDILWIREAGSDPGKNRNLRTLERYFPFVRNVYRKDLRPDEVIEKEQLIRLLERVKKRTMRAAAFDLLWNSTYFSFIRNQRIHESLPAYYPILQFYRLGKTEQKGVFVNTLHQAKGLEFEAVWIIGINEGNIPHAEAAESVTSMEEERRLLYVGMTRAQKYLSLSFSEEAPKSRFLTEIRM
ncbi:MAG: ATP-dependent helicase [Firmicutes bacterium]|nr:ATP-dependent helicase [Bacillota bacterium]